MYLSVIEMLLQCPTTLDKWEESKRQTSKADKIGNNHENIGDWGGGREGENVILIWEEELEETEKDAKVWHSTNDQQM